MPTVDLPGMRSISTDSACIARHRSSARPVIFAVLHSGVGLELEGRDDRTGMNLHDESRRRRTRGTSPRAGARRPSARARRSSARSSARRAARPEAVLYSPLRRSAGPLMGSGSGSGSGGAGTLTFGGLAAATDLGPATGAGGAAIGGGSASRFRTAFDASAAPACAPAAVAAWISGRGDPFLVCFAITSRRCCSRRRSSRQVCMRSRPRMSASRTRANSDRRGSVRSRTASR